MMKYFVLIFVLFLSICSCSTDDPANFYFDFIAVDSVSEIPEAFAVNQPDTIQVSYLRPSSCHGFNGFDIEKDGGIRQITIINKVVEQSKGCLDLVNDLRTALLVFNPEETGEVTLKFYNGEDVEGDPIFLTFNVPIIE